MSNPTCIAPGCRAGVHVKKHSLCQSHYNRWYRSGDLQTPKAEGSCSLCGVKFDKAEKTGPIRKYCSKRCQRKASYERRKDKLSAQWRAETAAKLASTVKSCANCGDSFTPERSMAQKYCSKKCSFDFHRDSSTRICSVDDCDRNVRAREMCSMHYRRWARSEGFEELPAWDDRRRANHHRRRALKLKLPADDIRPLDVYERDGWVCQICMQPVDESVKWPDPMSPSLDHVTPLSKGGHHVWENVALAHLECNVRKGDRVSVD